MALPLIMSKTGLLPIPPETIRNTLLASVAAVNPGYTAVLPASMIEDISSTDVASIAMCNQAQIDLVNSITPYGANAFLLAQLGNIYGVQIGAATNTSVYCNFTGTPGFVIPVGFTVSDGSHQYTVQDGGILDTNGLAQLYCLATVAGTWAIPANTVTQLITSVPSTVSLSVTNSLAGTPSTGAETEESYRARVLQAGIAPSQGALTYLKTKVQAVSGVQSRLVSVQTVGINYKIIVGGGDPYQVAYAIFSSLFDVADLQGSVLSVVSITKANPGVVTTNQTHGYITGQVINIAGVVGMTEVNNVPLTITVLSPTSFSIGVNSTAYTTYVSGGVITPNLRNITANVNNYPDNYAITFVNPPLQEVGIALGWKTTSSNFTSDAAVSQLAVPAIISYINSLPVGYAINQYELEAIFQASIASILPAQFISLISIAYTINNIVVTPVVGTGLVEGDPEGYFLTDSSKVSVTRVI